MKYLCINSVLLILSCTTQVDLSEQSKLEILETEAAFSQMANELGVAEAFVAFADDSAVLNRKNVLIMGIDSIRAHYSSATRQGTSLEWAPDFVDASKP